MPVKLLRKLVSIMHRYVYRARYSSNDAISHYRLGVAFGIALVLDELGFNGYQALEFARNLHGSRERTERK